MNLCLIIEIEELIFSNVENRFFKTSDDLKDYLTIQTKKIKNYQTQP